jgi:hypothetical protein
MSKKTPKVTSKRGKNPKKIQRQGTNSKLIRLYKSAGKAKVTTVIHS